MPTIIGNNEDCYYRVNFLTHILLYIHSRAKYIFYFIRVYPKIRLDGSSASGIFLGSLVGHTGA